MEITIWKISVKSSLQLRQIRTSIAVVQLSIVNINNVFSQHTMEAFGEIISFGVIKTA